MAAAGTRSSTRAVTSESDSRRAAVAMSRSAGSGAIGLAVDPALPCEDLSSLVDVAPVVLNRAGISGDRFV